MSRIKRNERVSAMARILTASPNRIFTLGEFCAMFDAAKSTISEDIELLRGVYALFTLGEIETVSGASGGVRYLPRIAAREAVAVVRETCETLADPARVLPGGYLYIADILGNLPLLDRFGTIIAQRFADLRPDFVLTVESKGIAFAAAVARMMGLPLAIARRGQIAHEGPNVAIYYETGQAGALQAISLASKAVQAGQSALLVDDFSRSGATMRGMTELMRAFSARVGGMCAMLHTQDESEVVPLMILGGIDGNGARILPAPWIDELAAREA